MNNHRTPSTPHSNRSSSFDSSSQRRGANRRTVSAGTSRSSTSRNGGSSFQSAQPRRNHVDAYGRSSSSTRQDIRKSPSRRHTQSGSYQTRRTTRSSQQQKPHRESFLNKISLRTKIIFIALFALIIGGAVAFLIDYAQTSNRAYEGVSIGPHDVSGMTQGEIIQLLTTTYGNSVENNTVVFFSSKDAMDEVKTAEELKAEENVDEQSSYESSLSNRDRWTVDAQKVGAYLNVEQLSQDALAVGREDGGLQARLDAAQNGRTIDLAISFNEDSVKELANEISYRVGETHADTNVKLNKDGIFIVVKGHDGQEVTTEWLEETLSKALFGKKEVTEVVAKVVDQPDLITKEQAQTVANTLNAATKEGLDYTYEDEMHHINCSELRTFCTAEVQKTNDGAILVPVMEEEGLKAAVLSSKTVSLGSGQIEVSFIDDNGRIMVESNATGTMPDVASAMDEIQASFFTRKDLSTPYQVIFGSIDIPQTMTFESALDAGLITKISSYTTKFSTLKETRAFNIELASSFLNNSICKKNGGLWSFNDIAGEANAEKGYRGAGAIVNGEYQDDNIGGGVCQVATTVFNAVYDAGYPITERHNHSLYIASYPKGRDAAIAFPDMDLIWENDTTSDVLLKMECTSSSVTANLYGVSPHYKVTTKYGEWEKGDPYTTIYRKDNQVAEGVTYVDTTGSDGSAISITRTVKDPTGEVIRTDTFSSYYQPKNKVIIEGTLKTQ